MWQTRRSSTVEGGEESLRQRFLAPLHHHHSHDHFVDQCAHCKILLRFVVQYTSSLSRRVRAAVAGEEEVVVGEAPLLHRGERET